MIPRILVIVGMHRSGTSLITQWLYRCGLFIGNNLFPPDVGNVEGHFEDSDFLAIHQKFLVRKNCIYTGFIDRSFPKLVASEKQELKDLIENKNKANKEWGWKDPRTCLFLDAYHELIPSAYYLVIVRGYHSTVNSMLTREYGIHMKKFRTKKGLSRLKWILFKKKSLEEIFEKYAEHFLKIWIYYYEQIWHHIRSLPEKKYAVVHYSCLVQNDKDVFARLKDEWQFSLDYLPFTHVYKKELLSEIRDVKQYIKDKELITKANQIEAEFKRFLCSSNSAGGLTGFTIADGIAGVHDFPEALTAGKL